MKRYLRASILGLVFTHVIAVVPFAAAETPLKFGWSSVTPHAANFTGDGRMELGLYDSVNGTAYVRQLNGEELASGLTMALSDYQAAFADYDGDNYADLGSYD